MNRFKCPQCNGNQFSTNSNENTPCIYCGNPTVKKMDTLDEVPGDDEIFEKDGEQGGIRLYH
jgi:hypothetical protein